MKRRPSKQWVSASDVGRAAYCPHYLELKHKGVKPSKEALIARAKGEQSHERFNQQAEDKRCYVATYLYGDDDVRTQDLRRFRDQHLAGHLMGQWFIRIYYRLSPSLVSVSKRVPAVNYLAKSLVDAVVKCIQKKAGKHD